MSKSKPSVESILAEAVEIASEADREQFVCKSCAGDAGLQRRVERMIADHFRAGNFLERPVAHLADTGAFTPSSEEDAGDTVLVLACPGTVIGPYKLLEQIGEGGMGLVFVAEQERPMRRRVALKLIKPGMDSRQVIARFEAERQALAMMDHPNIAKVYDGGTTREGRPYFVMEFVKGTPITEYCDAHRLTTSGRLNLFVHACHAVQHAHQKGIIHRDIKPSNVLVEIHDVRPIVKVIDFGIAKATGAQLTEKTLHTGFAQMVGTPLYMSPEQAGLSSLDVDTRSDIYSLGVLLYELLTGTTPFDGEALKKAGYDEMRRIIREEEPPRPSARFSTMHQAHLSTIAEQRGLEPHHLSGHLRGELDWIVMRALEKDRNRRYESASAFAEDVRRYLSDEPVQACPPSVGYRMRKYVRRHKAGASAVAVLLAVAAILIGGIGWVVGDRSARRAEAESRIAEALKVARDKLPLGNPHDPELITAARKAEAQLATGVVREELRQQVEQVLADLAMLDKLEQIRLDQANVIDGHFDTAGADDAYANAFRWYGIEVDVLAIDDAGAQIRGRTIGTHLAVALDHWALARKERQKQASSQENSATAEAQTWKLLLEVAQLADSDYVRGVLREAMIKKKSSDELKKLAASAIVEKLPPSSLIMLGDALAEAGALPLTVDLLRQGQQRHPADFWIHHHLAFILEDKVTPPKLEEAIACYRIALALRPQSPGVHLNFGNALREKGQLDQAIAAYEEAIRLKGDYVEAHLSLGVALYRKGQPDSAIAEYREALRFRPDYAEAHNNIGTVLKSNGQLEAAIAEYREAIRLKKELAEAHNNLGNALGDKGDTLGAIKELEEALRFKKDWPEAHYNLGRTLEDAKQLDKAIAEYRKAVHFRNDYPKAHYCLGNALRDMGDRDGAIKAYREALRLKNDFPRAHNNLGNLLADKGDEEGAIKEFREAVRLKSDFPNARNGLAHALYRSGRRDEAVAELRAAIKIRPTDADAHNNLAAVLQGMGQLDEAIAACKKAIELAQGDASPHNNLGITLARKGNLDDAIAAFRIAIKLQPNLVAAHGNLGGALARKGKSEEALSTFRELLNFAPNHPVANNDLAYFLSTCPDAKFRDTAKALELAAKATKVAPKNGDCWNTLGLAHFRAGHWSIAITTLEKADKLQTDDIAENRFFLAMAHWQLGHKEKAIEYFHKAVEWMDKQTTTDDYFRSIRAEAAALLQIQEGDPELVPPPPEVP
jgi:serine/threonine-protein kinase